MPSVLKSVLTKKQFRNWLNNKSPKTKVGKPSNSECCPIANYVKTEFKGRTGKNVEYIDVDLCDLYLLPSKADSEQHLCMPRWAAKFIGQIDTIESVNVTAERALKILDKVAP